MVKPAFLKLSRRNIAPSRHRFQSVAVVFSLHKLSYIFGNLACQVYGPPGNNMLHFY